MIVDKHRDNSGITLYVDSNLTREEAGIEAWMICEEGRIDMDRLIEQWHEHGWWIRFLHYCHTGK